MNRSSEGGVGNELSGLGRIIAEEGMLHILSFKAGSAWHDEAFIVSNSRSDAKRRSVGAGAENVQNTIPAQHSHCSAGLINFDYQSFYRQYVGWTVRDYQARDSIGYARLYDWLERREEEYRSGVRIDVALPPPEQRTLGANMLIDALAQARTVMSRNQADFRALRLTELPYLSLRIFIMKRLALRNAELAALADLGAQNAYRQACLQFLLPARAFSRLLSREAAGDHVSADPNSANPTDPIKPLAEGIV